MKRSREYKLGRQAFKEDLTSADCPFPIKRKPRAQSRTFWFDGFYDEMFYQKYGSPWPKE